MKTPILLLVLALTSISSTAFAASGQKQVVDLNRGWQFRLAPDSSLNHVAGVEPEVDSATLQRVADWTPAEVPGCIQTDLLRNKIIPEPFYRDNEKKLHGLAWKIGSIRPASTSPRQCLRVNISSSCSKDSTRMRPFT